MNAIKALFIISCIAIGSVANAGALEGVYGIHLYFDEKEFVDEMTISQSATGELSGRMHVPNDFDGDLENIKVNENEISFDLLVPRNAARPKDLVFHYEGRFFDSSHRQLVGFVTLKGEADFVASFTGFKRTTASTDSK
jgi:hypothetical protein